MALPMNKGFQNTWAGMKPRDREAYGKISAAATPKARRELDRDMRKMGQLHGEERRMAQPNREINDDPGAMIPPRFQGAVSPGMAAAFRQPWAPGVLQDRMTALAGSNLAANDTRFNADPEDFALNQETADNLAKQGLKYTGRIDNNIKPTWGGSSQPWNPIDWENPKRAPDSGFQIPGGRNPTFRDNMYLVGRDGPPLKGPMMDQVSNMIPRLPKRSSTLSPGIGMDGKRINYGRR